MLWMMNNERKLFNIDVALQGLMSTAFDAGKHQSAFALPHNILDNTFHD